MIQFTTIFRSTYPNTPQPPEPNTLVRLRKELQNAVDLQEFEKAVELRDKIKNLEDNKVKLEDLNFQLTKAVDQQDYEKAIELRDEIKKLS
jgi:protein-arginine kinase activator protein McsA